MPDAPTHALAVYTIYDHPTDFPQGYIARLFLVSSDGPVPTDEAFADAHLDEVRQWIQRVAPGAVRIPRSPEDDPAILETWL